MLFESRAFFVAKDLESPHEYQDAFEWNADGGMAAIADGVTAGLYCGPWARLLAHAAVVAPPDPRNPDSVRSWLAESRAAWNQQVDLRNLAWYLRPKLADGAMTTLLWIALSPAGEDSAADGYRLRAFAVGDCCLFHVRGGAVTYSFPMTTSGAFNLNPRVIGSVDRKADHLLCIESREAECRPGDLLVLCTDAVALWAISQEEMGHPIQWDVYWDMPQAAWREEIVRLRQEGLMRYDDTTLVLLRVAGKSAAVEAVRPAVEFPTSSRLFWWQHRRASLERSLSHKLAKFLFK